MTDPTPPAAPRPCGCGPEAQFPLYGRCIQCGQPIAPVSPEAAPPRCMECGKTEAEHFGPYCYPAAGYAPASRTDYRSFSPPLAEAAPPRATTPEPMTEARLAEIRAYLPRMRRYATYGYYADLLAEVDRLRAPLAGSPSLESGALLDALIVAEREAWEIEGYAGFDIAKFERRDQCRAELDRHISTLERGIQR